MIENLTSKQLLELLEETYNALKSREDVCVAQNGCIFLKECPDCGGEIIVHSFEFRGTQEDLDIILNAESLGHPFYRWKNYLKGEVKAKHIKLPSEYNYPPAKIGKWYCCQCGCRTGQWKPSQETAMSQFLDMPIFNIKEQRSY